MKKSERNIVFLDTYPFEMAISSEFQNQINKLIIAPNIVHLTRLGFNNKSHLYANHLENFKKALTNEGLFFVHYLRFRDYNPFEKMKGKWVIFYSIGDAEHKPTLKIPRGHYWYKGQIINSGKLYSNPPYYDDFFKNWGSFDQIPPFDILVTGT